MLLDLLKAILKIDGEEEDHALLLPILERGKARINNIVGVEIEYEEDEEAKELLLEYGRYAYNNAAEYFESNFERQLIRLQLKYLRLQHESNNE